MASQGVSAAVDTAKVGSTAVKTAFKIGVPVASVAAQTAMDATMGDGASPLNLTMDIVGYGAQEFVQALAEAAIGGPIGEIIVLVFQSASMLIDMFWDPYASYYNEDLDALKSQYETAYRYNLAIAASANWPLETKPVLLPQDADGNIPEAVKAELMDFLTQWYQDHSLISQAEQDQIVKITDTLRARELVFASYNPTNDFYSDPKKTLVASFMNDNATLVKLMAYALKKRQGLAIANLPVQIQNDLTLYKRRLLEQKAADKKEVETRLMMFLCILVCVCLLCSGASFFLVAK